MPDNTFVKKIIYFFDLIRLNKPIGFLLLMWPCWFALAILEQSQGSIIIWYLYFLVGSFLMRSAGCIINDLIDINIDATTNNSTYTNIASRGHNMISDGSGSRGSSSCSALFDVTNTTNCKVSFDVYTSRDSTTVNGDSDRDMLSAKFIRLTDT